MGTPPHDPLIEFHGTPDEVATASIAPTWPMYCRNCEYPLRGLASTRCPECGLAYDPADAGTYFLRPRTRWERFASPGTLAAVVGAYVVAWWVHVVGTLLGDPLGPWFDTANWLVCIILKIAAFLALFALLGRSCFAIAGNPRAAWRAFAIWSAVAVATICIMAALRGPLYPALDMAAAGYYSPDRIDESEIGSEQWIVRWARGEILTLEAGFAMLWSGLFAVAGYRMKSSIVAVAVAIVVGVVLLIVHVVLFDLVLIDYDNFHGDIFTGGLIVDLMLPFTVSDPYGTIGTFVYTGVALSCLLILRDPKNDPRAASRAGGPMIEG